MPFGFLSRWNIKQSNESRLKKAEKFHTFSPETEAPVESGNVLAVYVGSGSFPFQADKQIWQIFLDIGGHQIKL